MKSLTGRPLSSEVLTNAPRAIARAWFLAAFSVAFSGVLFLVTAPARAQVGGGPTWMALDAAPPGTPAEVILEAASSGPTQTTLTLVLHGFYVTPRIEPDGTPFSQIEVPGLQRLAILGAPGIPILRKSLAIVTGTAQVTLSSMTPLAPPAHFSLHVWPQNVPAMDEDSGFGTPEVFTLDPAIYASDAPYPAAQGTATAIQLALGSIPSSDIECHPIRWTPMTDDLEVIPISRWTFSHDGPVMAFNVITPDRNRIATHQFLNWGSIGTWIPPSYLHYQGEYLFIYPSAFAAAIKPLVTQKYIRGFNVTKLTTEAIGAITCNSVRTAIQSWYASTPSSSDHYCLLVGDIDNIPFCGNSDPDPRSDDPYGSVSSTNLMQRDIFVGRLPASNASQVTAQVTKIINYEDHPPGPLYYGSVLLVAHKIDPYTGVGDYPAQQEVIRTTSYDVNPLFVPYYGSQPGKTNAGVNNHINSGYGIVCYRGHGYRHAWTTWNLAGSCTGYTDPGECYTTSDIAALNNDPLNTIVWSIACHNSDLRDGNCIGRAWMHKTPGGAVAHYGATRGSGTLDNNVLEDSLFAAVWSKGITNIAHATTLAEDLARKWDWGSAASNAFEYTLFGDPDMNIRREMPKNWQVVQPAFISISGSGQSSLDIQLLDEWGAPIQHALVSIWKPGAGSPAGAAPDGADRGDAVTAAGDEAADNTYTDADGFVHFAMSGLTPGVLHFTVRDSAGDAEQNSIPVISAVGVGDLPRPAPGLWAEPSVTRGATTLRFGRALESGGTVGIFDAAGRPVAVLAVSRGASSLVWQGTSRNGAAAPSGVYFARLTTTSRELSARIVIRR